MEYEYIRTLYSQYGYYDINKDPLIRLSNEILISLPNIGHFQIHCHHTICHIIVDIALSPGDKTILDNVVANHKINNTPSGV